MNHDDRAGSTTSAGPKRLEAEVRGPVDSVSRRRAVLQRLGAGAALTGAPLAALGTSGGTKHCFHKDTPTKKVKATISGVQSAVASVALADVPESPGNPCTHYQNSANWPSDATGKYCLGHNGLKYRRTALYKTVFNCAGGGYNDWTIGNLMNNQPACPQIHWITACLNATKYGTQFSYLPTEVVAMHNDVYKNLDALNFFTYYQENTPG